MTPGEAAATTVAIIALVVSFAALGFSGWQAVTAHLQRTSPRPAVWTFEYPPAPSNWRIHNTGGSTATNVEVTVDFPLATDPAHARRSFNVTGAIAPNGSGLLNFDGRLSDPRKLLQRSPDDPSKWIEAPQGSSEGHHFVDQFALVEWRDHRGKSRKKRVPLW